jgi:glucokinase
MHAKSSRAELVVVADIGGTNARFALADPETLELSHIQPTLCADHANLGEALAEYFSGLPVKPRRAAFAVAAPVSGEAIHPTNSHWSFRISELCRAAGLEEIHVLNDFEALALSLPALDPAELHQIGGTVPEAHATKVVLGPGTGLGVAGLVWSGRDWIAVAGEGGHMSLGAGDAGELAILRELGQGTSHVSAERAISGPGLLALYRAVAAHRREPAMGSADVLARAASGDAVACEALGVFIAWLGRFAGNIALAFGARGGVYLGGGIAPRIIAALSAGPFREAFEQKGRMRAYLAPIPVYVIVAEFAALKGSAARFVRSSVCDRQARRPLRFPTARKICHWRAG